MCQGVRQYHDMSTCWHRVRLRISNSKRLLARTRVAIQGVSCVCMCAVCAHTKPALCVRGLPEYGMVLRYQVRPTLSKHEPHDVTWVRECTCCVGGACLALVPSLASKNKVPKHAGQQHWNPLQQRPPAVAHPLPHHHDQKYGHAEDGSHPHRLGFPPFPPSSSSRSRWPVAEQPHPTHKGRA